MSSIDETMVMPSLPSTPPATPPAFPPGGVLARPRLRLHLETVVVPGEGLYVGWRGPARDPFPHRPGGAGPTAPAPHGRIHTFIGTSPLHRKYQMGIDEAEVLERVTASVTRARGHTDDVEWSAMDATRTEEDFLCRCVEAAIKAGATTVNIPDTVGYAMPQQFGETIRRLLERVPNADKAVFSVHCHNDLGMATANSLAGVQNGARQVECTINGIGELPICYFRETLGISYGRSRVVCIGSVRLKTCELVNGVDEARIRQLCR